MRKLVFLSHIHEEKDLALLIKDALEDEFGGFVDVFVSSDGTSIPAGANFLKRIDDGLVNCCAAVYLISRKSVKRNWINFELGAVWIRSSISQRSGGDEIPALPICHSGIGFAELPPPLNNLNAIQASLAPQLESAFRSIQSAVGGRGKLKTDFELLSQKIASFEASYTLGSNGRKALELLGVTDDYIRGISDHLPASDIPFCFQGFVINSSALKELQRLEEDELKDKISISVLGQKTLFGNKGPVQEITVTVFVSVDLLQQYMKDLEG